MPQLGNPPAFGVPLLVIQRGQPECPAEIVLLQLDAQGLQLEIADLQTETVELQLGHLPDAEELRLETEFGLTERFDETAEV